MPASPLPLDFLSLPTPLSSIPRTPLLFNSPTPIHCLPNLSASFSPSNTISIHTKREDLSSPLAFGGNKLRKLEYVLPLIPPGTTTLVTEGGIQSNHTRQTAGVAAKLGLKCIVLLAPWAEGRGGGDDKSYQSNGNVQLDVLMGAEVRMVARREDAVAEREKVMREVGEKGYFIPSGASTHEMGGVGFARWVFELVEQEKTLGLQGSGVFDVVVVSCVSGSTLGGMLAGFKLLEKMQKGEAHRKRRVIGIDGSAKPIQGQRDLVLEIAKRTGRLIGLEEGDITLEDVVIDDRYHAGAYGKVDAATQDAVKIMARMEGVILDPVYTGKAAAGLIELVKHKEEEKSRKGDEERTNVLFVHTGGQPALSVYQGIEQPETPSY